MTFTEDTLLTDGSESFKLADLRAFYLGELPEATFADIDAAVDHAIHHGVVWAA